MPPFIIELDYNGTSLEELADHGLTLEDAHEVFEREPKYLPNKRARARRVRGLAPRWLMIGPRADGAMLTLVLERREGSRIGHVVTGWHSSKGERTRYHQPGGRRDTP